MVLLGRRSSRVQSVVPNDDLPEQAVGFVLRTGGEQQFVRLCRVAVAEAQRPQPVDDDRVSVAVAQLAETPTGHRVEGVDATVAEVADEQGTAEPTEVRRC